MVGYYHPATAPDSGPGKGSVFDRPGSIEVDRLRKKTDQSIEAMDSPTDLLLDAVNHELQGYRGPIPSDAQSLRHFVVNCIRSAAGPTAISAMLQNFIESDERIHIAHAIRKMLVLIRSQAKPALTCDAIAISMGIHLGEGRSLDEIAAAHGITKQALSKRGIRMCAELGFAPSPLMRSIESRESYRAKQCQRHAAAREAGLAQAPANSLRKRLFAARQHLTGVALRQASA